VELIEFPPEITINDDLFNEDGNGDDDEDPDEDGNGDDDEDPDENGNGNGDCDGDDDEAPAQNESQLSEVIEPQLPPTSSVPLDKDGAVGLIDKKEEADIDSFFEEGCGCNEKCSSFFDKETVRMFRIDCSELPRNELDLYILGQLTCTTFDSCDVRLGSRHQPQQRQRPGASYLHKGRKVCCNVYIREHFIYRHWQICRTMFLFLHGIGRFRLNALRHSLLCDGVTTR